MKKGDICLFNLTKGLGHEQSGNRPGIVVSNLVNGMLMVIPLTTNLEALRFSHTLTLIPDNKNKLTSESVALVFQLKSLDKSRVIQKMGVVDAITYKNLKSILNTLFK